MNDSRGGGRRSLPGAEAGMLSEPAPHAAPAGERPRAAAREQRAATSRTPAASGAAPDPQPPEPGAPPRPPGNRAARERAAPRGRRSARVARRRRAANTSTPRRRPRRERRANGDRAPAPAQAHAPPAAPSRRPRQGYGADGEPVSSAGRRQARAEICERRRDLGESSARAGVGRASAWCGTRSRGCRSGSRRRTPDVERAMLLAILALLSPRRSSCGSGRVILAPRRAPVTQVTGGGGPNADRSHRTAGANRSI